MSPIKSSFDSERIAFRPAELARLMDVSTRTIHRRIASGDLEARKLGASTVITSESARRLLEGLPKVAPKAA